MKKPTSVRHEVPRQTDASSGPRAPQSAQRLVDGSPLLVVQRKQLAQLRGESVPFCTNNLPLRVQTGIEALPSTGMDIGSEPAKYARDALGGVVQRVSGDSGDTRRKKRLKRQNLLKKLKTRREKNMSSRATLGKRVARETGFGPIGVSRGRGGQPMVSSRKGDFEEGGSSVGRGRYSELSVEVGDLEDIFTKKRPSPGSRYKKKMRRAAMLRGIVMNAENSEQRYPGSDKIVRAAVRTAKANGLGYKEIFTGDSPLFAMAAKGGAQSYNRYLETGEGLTEEQEGVLDYMSEDSSGSDVE